jgi:hypothetical protein
MTRAALSLRPTAVSIRLSDSNPKIVEAQFLSNGLSVTVDVPRNDFEMLVAKWADLLRNEELKDTHQIGLFRRLT